jgi:hypothetical protein
MHIVPQLVTNVSSAHVDAPQRWNPPLHVKPQLVPSHVAIAFAGGMHCVQLVPHDCVEVLSAQVPPQSWKPPLHVKPHVAPSHIAIAFAGGTHGVQLIVPHDCVEVLSAHVPPPQS